MQSKPHGLHVAIIMDGNGRWAEARGLPRSAGHVAGAGAVEEIVRAAAGLGIERLTLFALSADNWSRPASEVEAILALMEGWLVAHTETCVREGVRVSFIGRRDRMPDGLLRAVEHAEQATSGAAGLHLRLAVDYSSREAIVRAARRFNVAAALANASLDKAPLDHAPLDHAQLDHAQPSGARAGFGRMLALDGHADEQPFDVDLLVRSGGEQRLSDFLLWECAYAELVFSPCLWPDFTPRELERALAEFHQRVRRFGRVTTKDVG